MTRTVGRVAGTEQKDGPHGLPNFNIPAFDGIGANEFIVDVTHVVPGPKGKPVPAVDFISTMNTPRVAEWPWFQYLFIFLAIGLSFGGLLLLTATMKRYDATYSAAMFVGSFVVSTSIMSAAHYHTFQHLTDWIDLVMYPLGILILIVGVAILVDRGTQHESPIPASSSHANNTIPHPRENRSYSDVLTPNDIPQDIHDHAPVVVIPEVIPEQTTVVERTRGNTLSSQSNQDPLRLTPEELELVSTAKLFSLFSLRAISPKLIILCSDLTMNDEHSASLVRLRSATACDDFSST